MAILREASTVARAKCLDIPTGTEKELFERCEKGLGGGKGYPSSMMFDCLAGNPMEVEVRIWALFQPRVLIVLSQF